MYRHVPKNQLTHELHSSRRPVKTAHNEQSTHRMTKITWKGISWILVGIKAGAQMLLESGGKGKHKVTSTPKKILYKNGILIFVL